MADSAGYGARRGGQGAGGGRASGSDSSWLARRVQALASANPELAEDPRALLTMAQDPNLPDERLVPTATAVVTDANLKTFIDEQRARPFKDQLGDWDLRWTPEQQRLLSSAGYNPRASDLMTLGGLGLTRDERSGLGNVGDPIGDAWSWSKRAADAVTPDAVEKPFDAARHFVGAGISDAAGDVMTGLNWPVKQVQRGINTALLKGSRAEGEDGESFFTGWGKAWDDSREGGENFRAVAVDRAHELLNGDEELYQAAVAQAEGQDLLEYTMERYDLDPQTTELQTKYDELIGKVQSTPFNRAVSTLAYNRATFGQDVANMLDLEGGTASFNYTAAGADLLLALKADPLLAVGKLRAANIARRDGFIYRATRFGDRAARDINPLHQAVDFFREVPKFRAKAEEAAQLWREMADAGSVAATRRMLVTSREYARAIPQWAKWEAAGNRIESADDVFDWFKSTAEGGGLVPLLSGAYGRARDLDLVLPHFTTAGETFARAKLAGLNRIDITADWKKIAREIDSMGEGLASQFLSADQLTALQSGAFKTLGSKTLTRVLRPGAQLTKKLTTQIRRNQRYFLLDDNPNFFGELERWAAEGHVSGLSYVQRDAFVMDMLKSPTVEQRRVLAGAYMQDMAEASGMLRNNDGRVFWSKFLDHKDQAYTFNGWDRIKGGQRAAILPHMQVSNAIAVPSFIELSSSVAQTQVMKLFTKLNSEGLNVALSRFWKVPVLLRVGFVPRAAGEEMLAFILGRPGEYSRYVRANIASVEDHALLAPLKPFFLPLRGLSKGLSYASPSLGGVVESTTNLFARMLSDPVRWWARRGADTDLVSAIKDWRLYDKTLANSRALAETDDSVDAYKHAFEALRGAGKDPFMMRAMVEGFVDVSASSHGLVAQAAGASGEPVGTVTLLGRGRADGRRELPYETDMSRFVAYPNVNAPKGAAESTAKAAGVEMAERGNDVFPAMYIHGADTVLSEPVTRGPLQELARRFVGPRVQSETAAALGFEDGRAAIKDFRSTWNELFVSNEKLAKRIAATLNVDQISPQEVERLLKDLRTTSSVTAARLSTKNIKTLDPEDIADLRRVAAENKVAQKIVDALTHEGMSANTKMALLGDLVDGERLIFDGAYAEDILRARIASELQDPANRAAVERMVRSRTDQAGRRIANPVPDGHTPLYGIVGDQQALRHLDELMSASGPAPQPGSWPMVQGSRDRPSFEEHWLAIHDMREDDLRSLSEAYFAGGATHAPVASWGTHDYRRAEALKGALESQYDLTGRLSVAHTSVPTNYAVEGFGMPLDPNVVHRIEGGAATDLYQLGPGTLPNLAPLTEAEIVDWASAVDDKTVAAVIRLADDNPEAFERLIAAARTDYHSNYVVDPDLGGRQFVNPNATSLEAFAADPIHAVLPPEAQQLNRHFGKDFDVESFANQTWANGIAQARYVEHPDYLEDLSFDLRSVGKPEAADEAMALSQELGGTGWSSLVMGPGGKINVPENEPFDAVVARVKARANELHSEWLDAKLTQALGDRIPKDITFPRDTPGIGDVDALTERNYNAAKAWAAEHGEDTNFFIGDYMNHPEEYPTGGPLRTTTSLDDFAHGAQRGLLGEDDYTLLDHYAGFRGDQTDRRSVLNALAGTTGTPEFRAAMDRHLAELGLPDEFTVYRGHGAGGSGGQLTNVTLSPQTAHLYRGKGEVSAYRIKRSEVRLVGNPREEELIVPSGALFELSATPSSWVRSHAEELFDDLEVGGAPALERVVAKLPEGERDLAQALLWRLSRYNTDTRTAALERSVMDPLRWARGEDSPAWAREFADEIRLSKAGQTKASLEEVLARRASLPTPGVLPGDLFENWAGILAQNAKQYLMTPDGELLHAVTQPALRGRVGLNNLARVDMRDLPAAVTGPARIVRPPSGGPGATLGARYDQLTGKGFEWIGEQINSIVRKPLYLSNYVRESSANRYLMKALIDPEFERDAKALLGNDTDQIRDVWRMLEDHPGLRGATSPRARQNNWDGSLLELANNLELEGRYTSYEGAIDRMLGLNDADRATARRYFENLTHAEKVVADSAMTRAVTKSIPFIDDHAVRSQYAQYMRNLQPFFFAEEAFYKRWVRTLTLRPEAIQRGQQYMMGLRHAGVVHRDENGEEVFTYPGSAEGLQAVNAFWNNTVGRLRPDWKATMPVDMALTGKVARTLPGVGNFGAPGWSPVVSIPMGALAQLFPEIQSVDTADGFVSGPGKRSNLIDRVVPAQYQKLWDAVTHDPEVDAQMASSIFQSVQYMAVTHPELIPDGTDGAETDRFKDQIRMWARQQLIFRAAFGFIGPASPANALDDGGLNEESRKLIATLGMEEGLAELIRRHPDLPPEMLTAEGVYQTKVPSRAFLPSTEGTQAWMADNEGFIQRYPDAALFLLPEPEADNAYDLESYFFQIANGYRVRRSLDDTWKELKFRQDAPAYFNERERLDRDYAAAQTAVDRLAIRAARTEFTQRYLATHPVFADRLGSAETSEQRKRSLDDLEKMMLDTEALPNNPATRAAMTMWRSYKNIQGDLEALSYSRTTASDARKKELRAGLVQWGNAFVRLHPETRGLWERIIKPEVNTSPDPEETT